MTRTLLGVNNSTASDIVETPTISSEVESQSHVTEWDMISVNDAETATLKSEGTVTRKVDAKTYDGEVVTSTLTYSSILP